AAFGLEDAAAYLDPMVEARITNNVEKRADRTGLLIEGAEDQPCDPSQHEGAGAHGAWLESDDKGQPRQPPRSQPPGRLPQREKLGVCSRIMPDLPLIARSGSHGASLVEGERGSCQ